MTYKVIAIFFATFLLIAGRSQIFGNDLKEPKERWLFKTNSHLTFWGLFVQLAPLYRDNFTDAVLEEDRVYAVTEQQLIVFKRDNGATLLKRKIPFNGRLLNVGATLILYSFNYAKEEISIAGLRKSDGEAMWVKSLPHKMTGRPFERSVEVNEKADTLYIYSFEDKVHNVVTLQVSTGQLIAERNYDALIWPNGIHHSGTFFFGYEGSPNVTADRTFVILNKDTGQIAWSLPLSSKRISVPLIVENAVILAVDDQIMRLNIMTGKPDWTTKIQGLIGFYPAEIILYKQMIAIIHQTKDEANPDKLFLSFYQVEDGKVVSNIPVSREEFSYIRNLRKAGVYLVGERWPMIIEIIDPEAKKIKYTFDFKKRSEFYVYQEGFASIADNDDKGFLVRTSGGKLLYYAIDDF